MRTAALLLALAACSATPVSPDPRENTADSLRAQLATADDIKRGFILDELEKIELRRAQEANTVFAYRRFLAEFPHGDEALTARTMLENLVYAEAEQANTQEAWGAFLDEFPRGKRTAEARAKLGALVIAEAVKSSDLELVRRTLGRFPEHPDRQLLVAREDELSWNAAKTGDLDAASRYLVTHPAGAFRQEAIARRESLERQDILESEDLVRAEQRASASDASPETKEVVSELELRFATRSLDTDGLARVAQGPGASAEKARKLLESLGKVPLADDVKTALAAASPGAGLGSHEELLAKLKADDPLDRVDALRALAEVASPHDLDAVLDMAESRYLDVRLEAIESLRTMAKALPAPIWRNFVRIRETEALTRALSAAPWRRVAVLRDADGRGREALAAWQEVLKADPDDLAGRARVLALQQEIGDRLGVSSSARELSKAALSFADGRWLQPPDPTARPEERRDGPGKIIGVRADVTVLRQLCGALTLGDRASQALAQLRTAAGPGEQELLGLAIADADRTLARLRSKKIELESQAKRQDATYVPCGTDRTSALIVASRKSRAAAIEALGKLADPRTAAFVASLANSPSEDLRKLAQATATTLAEAPEPKPPEPPPAPPPPPEKPKKKR